MRLQKFLSQQGICSRRTAEEWISAGRIRVNGSLATLGDRFNDGDTVTVDGDPVKVKEKKTLVLAWNKPTGVEVTFDNKHGGKTLQSFDFGPERVIPIGRLDKDSHGLILLTNNGDLANELMHPRYGHEKSYIVRVDRNLTSQCLDRMSNGTIEINGKKVSPCRVQQTEERAFKIILKEGRNRQIRRMCEACGGLEVVDLLRIRVNTTHLDDLRDGAFRKLSDTEVSQLRERRD